MTGESTSNQTVQVSGNHVFFYCPIDRKTSLDLRLAIKDVCFDLRSAMIEQEENEDHRTPIILHINSDGGDAIDAIALSDMLRTTRWPIHSKIEGSCLSAASLLSIVCQKRYIQRGSFMLMHQLRGIVYGTHNQMIGDLNGQQKIVEAIVDIYEENSSLTRKQIRKMMDGEYWMDSAECLRNGFVDIVEIAYG